MGLSEKKNSTYKSPGTHGFTGEILHCKQLGRSSHLLFSNYSQKFPRKESFQTNSMTPATPWYQNQTKISHKTEKYSPSSLTNIDAKFLNKILANESSNVIHRINKLKNKNQMNISIDAEKDFEEERRRWWNSKTRRSPFSPQIHQKYSYTWNCSYRTPTERWQKNSDLPKGKKLPTYLGRTKEKRKNRDKRLGMGPARVGGSC